MKIVTGHVGDDHITSNDVQAFNQGVFGAENYVLNVGSKFAASIANGVLTIQDGEGVMQGVHFRQPRGESATIDLPTGSSGTSFITYICASYHKHPTSGVEFITLDALSGVPSTGEPVPPPIPSSDIIGGDTSGTFPLYSVKVTDFSTFSDPVPLFTVVNAVSDMNNTLDALTQLRNVTITKESSINEATLNNATPSVNGDETIPLDSDSDYVAIVTMHIVGSTSTADNEFVLRMTLDPLRNDRGNTLRYVSKYGRILTPCFVIPLIRNDRDIDSVRLMIARHVTEESFTLSAHLYLIKIT